MGGQAETRLSLRTVVMQLIAPRENSDLMKPAIGVAINLGLTPVVKSSRIWFCRAKLALNCSIPCFVKGQARLRLKTL